MKTNLGNREARVQLSDKLRGRASVTGQAHALFHDIDVMCCCHAPPGMPVADKWIALSGLRDSPPVIARTVENAMK
ncbi:hypothetical protein ACFSHT_38335 [Paraburkholderia silviterrae]|uniref:Uncharacterized protein n=1 Tax=Paraburkholderia silviterrae TaxID=2528715 RepID=A0A4R5M049_9BURK|nr:hypothetical protein [Paraburkholderia silviterrae]TDG18386.1 hypothetical protein EYW47_34440 [Paraburkholderia silviterrae]